MTTTNLSCHVIISDYVVERRMSLLLDAKDFGRQTTSWNESDSLLLAFQDHPFFAGCTCWADLTLPHLHVLLINMLKICADHLNTNSVQHPMYLRLNFLLCSLIHAIQKHTGSVIDLLKITRISPDDVLYDYNAHLDIVLTPPKNNLRVVIDNG